MRTARALKGALVAGAVAALAVTPAFAQTPEQPASNDDQVSCEPANPDPGGETTCTAEGMKADSAYDWTATFADGTERTGAGFADGEGASEFTVTVPEGEEAEGDYTVTVTGTDEDDSEYEATHEGTVGGSDSPLAALTEAPSEEPSEDPSEDPSEEPSEDPSDDDAAPAPGGDSGQVNPAPSGAVATGAGGTASGTTGLATVSLLALAALAVGAWAGQKANPTVDL